jgi:predicted PurR-regulated permease PerM
VVAFLVASAAARFSGRGLLLRLIIFLLLLLLILILLLLLAVVVVGMSQCLLTVSQLQSCHNSLLQFLQLFGQKNFPPLDLHEVNQKIGGTLGFEFHGSFHFIFHIMNMIQNATATYNNTETNTAPISASVLQAQHRQGPMRASCLRSSSDISN